MAALQSPLPPEGVAEVRRALEAIGALQVSQTAA